MKYPMIQRALGLSLLCSSLSLASIDQQVHQTLNESLKVVQQTTANHQELPMLLQRVKDALDTQTPIDTEEIVLALDLLDVLAHENRQCLSEERFQELCRMLDESREYMTSLPTEQTRVNGFKYHPTLLVNILNVENAIYSTGEVQITKRPTERALSVTGLSFFNGDVTISGKIITTNNRGTDIVDDNLIVTGDLTVNGTITGTVVSPLSGDVTGTTSNTIVSFVGGQTAADVAQATQLTLAATPANVANTIVRRDGAGNFSAGTITATLNGNSTGFTGPLAGDVIGNQSTTQVAFVGGQTAAAVAAAAVAVAAGTSANVPNTLVLRDGNGGFSSGPINATNDSGYSIIANGSINLIRDTQGSIGEIHVGGVRFMSNCGAQSNTFLGRSAGIDCTDLQIGNLVAIGFNAGHVTNVASGSGSTFVGCQAGELGSSGLGVTGIGYQALRNVSNGGNTAVGYQSLTTLDNAINNSAVGVLSLQTLGSGNANTALGSSALAALTTGSNNLALGASAGSAYTSGETNNALLASTGVMGESNAIRLGNNSHTNLYTSTNLQTDPGGNFILALNTTTGEILRASSSARYKDNIKPLDVTILRDLEQLRPVSYTKKGHAIVNYGLIAEEVAEINEHLAAYNQEGQPENVNYMYIIPMLILAFQQQQDRIAKLERTIETLIHH